jgi:hypothetical protein
MARVGFRKTYAAGAFDKVALRALFELMKAHVHAAGFNVLLDDADGIDFIRMNSPAGTADDDVPHWAFSIEDADTFGRIYSHAVYGDNYLAPDARTCRNTLVAQLNLGDPPPAVTVRFAVDGFEGWWWLNATVEQPNSPTGLDMKCAGVGVSCRRYPADHHQGLCARYGLWDPWGDWRPAYQIKSDGALDTHPWSGVWSPLGMGWNVVGRRHPSSPLPRMAVPQFPAGFSDVTACVLGEFNEVLVLSDGYAQDEAVAPGWIAMVGDARDQPYAVRAPLEFAEP